MKPKPAMVINGESWWNFCFEYDFGGATFAFDITARSADEAHERLKKIALARYVGQADGNPVSLLRGGFMIPLVCWWRNRRWK